MIFTWVFRSSPGLRLDVARGAARARRGAVRLDHLEALPVVAGGLWGGEHLAKLAREVVGNS